MQEKGEHSCDSIKCRTTKTYVENLALSQKNTIIKVCFYALYFLSVKLSFAQKKPQTTSNISEAIIIAFLI